MSSRAFFTTENAHGSGPMSPPVEMWMSTLKLQPPVSPPVTKTRQRVEVGQTSEGLRLPIHPRKIDMWNPKNGGGWKMSVPFQVGVMF